MTYACVYNAEHTYTKPIEIVEDAHKWDEGVITTPATCRTEGVKTFTCSLCGDSYTEVIAASGHKYSNGKCTVCGNVDPNCSHSYTSKVTTAATCTNAGVKTYTCSKCGNSYTESIAATGHSYSGGKCGSCGDTKVVALPGDFNSWASQAMTWTSSGYTYSMNLSAGTYKFKLIKDGTWLGNNGEIWDTTTATSDIGWEFVDWADDCELIATGGTYFFTFNFDTNMLVIEYVHTHAYTAGTVVAPTCTATGLTEGKHCSVCKAVLVKQETVAALGHTEAEAVKENEVAATCTAEGSYDEVVYCTVCDAELSRDTVTVDALGHKAGNAAVSYTHLTLPTN